MQQRTSSASSIRHVLLVAVLLAGSFVAVVTTAAPVGAAPTAAEREVATLVNDYRIARGLPPLPLDGGMTEDARAWSAHMSTAGVAHARDFGRSCARFPSSRNCRENVGYGSSPAWVQSRFEQSSGHAANLLCDCTHIGVGVVTRNGRTYVTQRLVHDGRSSVPPMRQSLSPTNLAKAQGFVRNAYRDLLGRDPNGGELDHWTTRVLSTTQRTILARGLGYSDEWIGRLVDSYYRVALGRGPDPSGRHHWVTRIRTKAIRPADAAALFYASDEYFNRRGRDLGAWIDDLYRELLGRRSDPAGREHWLRIGRRHGRAAVAHGIYNATESLHRRVNQLYVQLLDRPADRAGRNHWAGVLHATRNDVELAISLVTSDEYHRRS